MERSWEKGRRVGGGGGVEEKTEIKVVSFTSRIEAHLDRKRGVLLTR